MYCFCWKGSPFQLQSSERIEKMNKCGVGEKRITWGLCGTDLDESGREIMRWDIRADYEQLLNGDALFLYLKEHPEQKTE